MKWSKSWIALFVLVGMLGLGADVAAERRGDQVAATKADAPVNINTAGVKQLMTLEGVGQKVAEKVVEYRTAHGPFKKPEEIRKVQGIGPALWEKNRERIVVK
jgi:competence protein ComEA